MSVVLYTCIAVRAEMCVCVGGQGMFHSLLDKEELHDLCVCVCVCVLVFVCVKERETHRDSRLGRSHGASSGSLSSWLFCSILKVTHRAVGYRCNRSVCDEVYVVLCEGTLGRANISIMSEI